MAEIKWIKLYVEMFNKKKIKKIRRLPDGDKILLIWIMLLAQAGICNAGGVIFLTPSIPYTPDDLADELGFSVDTIKLALQTFVAFEMLEVDAKGYLLISNWEEHQQEDKMQAIREYNRQAKAMQRQKQKEKLMICQGQCQGQIKECQGTDIDIDKDIEEDKEININEEIEQENLTTYVNEFFNLYNSIAKRLPKAQKLSESRKAKIKARLKNADLKTWEEVFTKCEASDFCCGVNNQNWTANIDWLISNDNNYVKVLEGKYDNKFSLRNNSNNLSSLQSKGMDIL